MSEYNCFTVLIMVTIQMLNALITADTRCHVFDAYMMDVSCLDQHMQLDGSLSPWEGTKPIRLETIHKGGDLGS